MRLSVTLSNNFSDVLNFYTDFARLTRVISFTATKSSYELCILIEQGSKLFTYSSSVTVVDY